MMNTKKPTRNVLSTTKYNKSLWLEIPRKIANKLNYFGDNSVLHGIGHIFSLKPVPFLKMLFWFTMLAACGLGATIILSAVLQTSGKAVSNTVETNYLDFVTPFPAVTICEYQDTDRYKKYLQEPAVGYPNTYNTIKQFYSNNLPLTLKDFYKDVTFWNKNYCKTCAKCQLNSTCVEDLEAVVAHYRYKCTHMLTACTWDGQEFPCCQKFLPMVTEYGECYSFNSRLTSNDSHLYTVSYTSLPNLVIGAKQPIVLRIHSPDDVLHVASEIIFGTVPVSVPIVSDFEILVGAEEHTSDPQVTYLPSSVRGCLMHNERPEFAQHWPYKQYTYGSCVWYCRTIAQIELCNCTHHFMMKFDNVEICDIKGLACLNKNPKAILAKSCDCPFECEEIKYKIIHIFKKRYLGLSATKELYERGSRGTVRFVQPPSMRSKRRVNKDILSLVVDVGGVGGVFFGASLLGLIEIFYLFCIRKQSDG